MPFKKLLAFLFLGLYLLSSDTVVQMLKLPMLFHHYSEHKAADQKTTVLGFLKIHYDNNGLPDADHEKDEKLPYKSNESNTNPAVKTFTSEPASTVITHPVYFGSNVFPVYSENGIPSACLASIWQPPKSC